MNGILLQEPQSGAVYLFEDDEKMGYTPAPTKFETLKTGQPQ